MSAPLVAPFHRSRPTRQASVGPGRRRPFPGGIAPALGCLALVAAAACAPRAEPEAESDSGRGQSAEADWTPPGPRIRVGGLLGFQSRSRVRFLDAQGNEDRSAGELLLTATYAFPDRARWQLEPREGDPSDRRLLFVYGSGAWAIQPRSAASEPISGENARAVRLMFLLRRAVLTWPGGLEWNGEGEWRTARAPGGLVLRARLGADGLPGEIESRLDGGPPQERILELQWYEPRGPQPRPARWALFAQGRPIWREELLALDTRARHIDEFFLPPDRRPRPASGATPIGLVVVPARAERRVPLDRKLDWPQVPAAFHRLRQAEAAALAERGRALDRTPRAEVDAAGRPAALLLVIPGAGEPPPGYIAQGEGNALAAPLSQGPPPTPAMLGLLRKAAPVGSRPAGPPRVEIRPQGASGPPGRVLLVLEPAP